MSKNKDFTDVAPVFKLQPLSDTRVKCRHIGFCKDLDKMTDEVLEDLKINPINSYSLIGKFCACNIIGNYLVQHTKLPVFYLSVLYTKRFVTGCLFNITLNFEINEEYKEKLDNPKKYVNNTIDGKYTIEISVPEENNFVDKIKQFVKDSIFPVYVKEFSSVSTLEEQNKVLDKIDADTEAKIEVYRKFLEVKKVDRLPNKAYVYNLMKGLCEDPIFRELMIHGMALREKERAEEKSPDMSFEPPKNVINLRDLGKDMTQLDKNIDEILKD
jgi:hypothetical protein